MTLRGQFAPQTNAGIYLITNTVSGHRYVGSSVIIGRRWSSHRYDLRHGLHRNEHLQRAWRKYGEGAFTFAILENVLDPLLLLARETHYITTISPEYNMQPVAGSRLGCKDSPETRAKKAAVWRGRAHSAETKAKMAASQRARLSTPEQKQRLRLRAKALWSDPDSAFAKPKPPSALQLRRASEIARARVWTPEMREKVAAARRGVPLAPEHRAKIAQAGVGRKPSEETRARLRAAQSKRPPISNETRARQREAQRRRFQRPEEYARLQAFNEARRNTA